MATIRLKDRKSHTGNIQGHEVKFTQDQGLTTEDPHIIAYCKAKPGGMFLVTESAPKPAAKPAPVVAATEEAPEAPAPKRRGGKRRKVKVEDE